MPPCNPLLYGWKLNVSWGEYVLVCLFLALVIRVAHSYVRALAIIRGDDPDAKDRNKPKDLPVFSVSYRFFVPRKAIE